MTKPVFRKISGPQPKKKKKTAKAANVSVAKLTKEVGLLGRALRYGGGLAGGAIGAGWGQAEAGSRYGSSLGASISRWLGAGDYAVGANSIVKSGQIPGMHDNNQSTIIRHKEYITDIITSSTVGAFSSRTFALNPGLAQSFPWLAGIAQQYQEYRIKGMVYHFVSSSGDSVGSTNTSLPVVIMATQYRSSTADFEDKVSMLNAYFSCDAKASEDFCHPVECDPKENPFNVQYIRGGAVPSGEDIKTYDLGKFTVATVGCQAASVNVGELWCTYEIELKKPYPTAQLDLFNQVAHFIMASASTGNLLGSLSVTRVNTVGVTFNTTNQLQFPRGTLGKYLIVCWWRGVTASTGITAVATNATLSALFDGGNQQEFMTSAAYTSGGPTFTSVIDIADPNVIALYTLSVGALTTAGACDILITQLPDTVT